MRKYMGSLINNPNKHKGVVRTEVDDPKQIINRNDFLRDKKPVKEKYVSVRVSETTRFMINCMVDLNRAKNVDSLIHGYIIESYENELTKEEKQTFDMNLKLFQNRR